MKKLGIKYQILLITLIPVLLIDSFFTYKHINNSINSQSELLHHRGRALVQEISGSIGFQLAVGNEAQTQAVLEKAILDEDILQASFFNPNGHRIAEASGTNFESVNRDDYIYFRKAVLLPDAYPAKHEESEAGAILKPEVLGWVNLSLSRLPLQQQVAQILTESIVLFVSVLLVTVLLTSFISRRITQPVFRLIKQLRQVEKGQLGKTMEPGESNELGALQAGFNRMTGALLANRRHLNRRIQQATQQLSGTVTDLEARNRELGFSRDLAQNANRTKSEFLANMSHEIRTPINGIKGFIGLLAKSKLDPAQRRYVDIVTRSTADLTSIVNEILDFSKMESGKLNLVEDAFDLHEVIEQTRDILFINALAKDIDLNLILFSDTPRWVIGDKLRLKQILLNLIGNAIKFTDQGRVIIRVCLEDSDDDRASIRISVEDSGIGISDSDQQSLFQTFSQVENSGRRHYSGSGLGLVISKNLAALMGGGIDLKSTVGQGSCFNLTLPFKLATGWEPSYSEAETRVLILAAGKSNLMEIRTLFDRAGAITETELVDPTQGTETILGCIQRNLDYIDMLVFDLRHFDIDLEPLLEQVGSDRIRIVMMHYDPGYELPETASQVEFISVINSSCRIARILNRSAGRDKVSESVIEPTPTSRKKVLLVDDNRVNLKLASELIRLWGHEVHEADHANNALALFRQRKFDMIILDIQMPDIDGVSLLHMLREISPDDSTIKVALTANVLNNEAERLLNLGFDHFLGKPIDEKKFRALLDEPLVKEDKAETTPGPADPERTLDYARSLNLAAGNESLLKQILQILQRDIPEQRQHLADAFEDMDLDRLGALAHKLHGVTCYASLPRLRRIVLAFQQLLKDATRDSLKSPVDELDAELAAIETEVNQCLQKIAENALSN